MTTQATNDPKSGDEQPTRLYRLAAAALLLTLLQTAFGAFTRGSGSGFGCRDRWPLCEGGVVEIGNLGGLFPRLEAAMLIEWTHRWIGALVVAAVIAVTVHAWRRQRWALGPARAAVGIVVAQSLLGAAVVLDYNNKDLVTLHLVGATALLAVLADVTVRARLGATSSRWWHSRWPRRHAVVAVGVLATLLLGSTVHDMFVGGWPLVGDQLVPPWGLSRSVDLHIAHRVIAGVMVPLVAWAVVAARRDQRPQLEQRLLVATLTFVLLNVALGGVHVFTQVSSTAVVVAHLGIGALAWVCAVAGWSAAARTPLGDVDAASDSTAAREPADVR